MAISMTPLALFTTQSSISGGTSRTGCAGIPQLRDGRIVVADFRDPALETAEETAVCTAKLPQ
ncbi:hypothetical protein ACWGDX_30505 [Streptomyces sp. NPDC055025]